MRRGHIVLATGIYPPAIGGPATYVFGLKRALEGLGEDVEVVNFGMYLHLPSGLRHFVYIWRLFWVARGAFAIVAFDTFTVAVPSVLVSRIINVPVVVRVGGDFLWEMYTARTVAEILLSSFYTKDLQDKLSYKERLVHTLTRWAIARADMIIFSTAWMQRVWDDSYHWKQCVVVENPREGTLTHTEDHKKVFLWFVRDTPLKNGGRLRKAFALAKRTYPDIELEEGIVPHEELVEKIRKAWAILLPSISEVSPNYILDALRCRTPFLLTKDSGYADTYGEYGVIVDPVSVDDIKKGIEKLSDEDEHTRLREKLESMRYKERSFEVIAKEVLELLKTL